MTEKKLNEKVYLLVPVFGEKENVKVYDNFEERIAEAEALVESAGATIVGYGTQNIREVNPATIFGKGKLACFKTDAEEKGATTVICDCSLSPAQAKNLSDFFDLKTIDKTALILDIFALNARTNEGKLQVEVAQLEYLLPRLKGQGKSMSRLGGGIGTRGPGETKLETDRRHILSRIKNLKSQLQELAERRERQNERRSKNGVLTVALAGYTNAGKSTLLNLLSGSDALAEDRLFATLDPTARKVRLGKTDVVFFDTVGFIRDIPTDLIEAFKSTLSCIKNADFILNVCDLTRDFISQSETTDRILKEIGVMSPVIKVYNKCDNIRDFTLCDKNAIIISARTGQGVDELKRRIENFFDEQFVECVIRLDYSKQDLFFRQKKYAERSEIKYLDNEIEIKLRVKKTEYHRFAEMVESEKIKSEEP